MILSVGVGAKKRCFSLVSSPQENKLPSNSDEVNRNPWGNMHPWNINFYLIPECLQGEMKASVLQWLCYLLSAALCVVSMELLPPCTWLLAPVPEAEAKVLAPQQAEKSKSTTWTRADCVRYKDTTGMCGVGLACAHSPSALGVNQAVLLEGPRSSQRKLINKLWEKSPCPSEIGSVTSLRKRHLFDVYLV